MEESASLLSLDLNLSPFARDVKKGLKEKRKRISSKYLYDSRGSELFCQIMALPEYYPTDAEKEIFESQGQEFFRSELKDSFQIVELGAGDGLKTKILLEKLLEQGLSFRYTPVDICRDSISELTIDLARSLPQLEVKGAVADYTDFFRSQEANPDDIQNVVLFLGSNIGNFTNQETVAFLRGIRENLGPDDLMLIGFDLKKDIKKLTEAYNDSQGITAEFNLNLLHRMNRELGSEIDVNSFNHYGFYNPFSGAMESCLISTKEQDIEFAALKFSVHFDEYEPIHLEYSFKYTLAEIEALAQQTGFHCLRHLRDSNELFVDSIWKCSPDQ